MLVEPISNHLKGMIKKLKIDQIIFLNPFSKIVSQLYIFSNVYTLQAKLYHLKFSLEFKKRWESQQVCTFNCHGS